MRGAAVAAALVALAAGAAAAATPKPATIVVRPATAGARATTVTLTLSGYPLVCGRPNVGTIAVSFPAAERLPARIRVSAVRIANASVRSVSLAGRTVTIGVSPTRPGEMICQTFTLGRATLTLLPAAGLGNPNRAGTYTVTAKHGTETYSAQFRVSG